MDRINDDHYYVLAMAVWNVSSHNVTDPMLNFMKEVFKDHKDFGYEVYQAQLKRRGPLAQEIYNLHYNMYYTGEEDGDGIPVTDEWIRKVHNTWGNTGRWQDMEDRVKHLFTDPKERCPAVQLLGYDGQLKLFKE